jgi:hypothetical protein
MDRALGLLGLKEVLYLIPPFLHYPSICLTHLLTPIHYHTLLHQRSFNNYLDFDDDNQPTDFEST